MRPVIDVSGHDRAVIGVTVLDPDDAELTARLIARYARDPGDGDLIADVLGIDEGARCWNAEARTAERIMRLADSLSRCDGCGYRVTSANHRSLCRGGS